MWLFIAILVLIQAPMNSADSIEQKTAINPETFMNVVSRKFEFALSQSLRTFVWGREGWRVDVERAQVTMCAGFVKQCDMTLPPYHH